MSRCVLTMRLAVLFGLVALSGCFYYTEEIEFDEKGIGQLRIDFDQGELNFAERAAASLFFKENPFNRKDMGKKLPPGVEMVEYSEETKDKRKIVHIVYKFDDLNKFAQWKRNDEKDLIFRGLSLNKVGNVWVFKRPGKARDASQLEKAKKHASGSKIVLKLTGPGKLVTEESNAHRMEGENTCVWEGSFPELLGGKNGQGTVMKAQYSMGSPLLVAAIVGVILVVVAGGGAVFFLRKKPKAAAGKPGAGAKGPGGGTQGPGGGAKGPSSPDVPAAKK